MSGWKVVPFKGKQNSRFTLNLFKEIRWDLRSKAQPLERITLAHSCAVLSMDWQSPGINESGLGWIVTSGMDRRVKVRLPNIFISPTYV